MAEDALDRQVSESQSVNSMARRDAESQSQSEDSHRSNGRQNAEPDHSNSDRNGKPRNEEPATNKQVQFLQTLAKRQKLFGAKLEGIIEGIIGRRCTPYDLTKKEAGQVIDQLSGEESESNRPRR